MTIYRARVLDVPDDPFTGGVLRSYDDCALVVVDGVIVARGPLSDVRRHDPDGLVVDLRDGWLLPGLVDTHVHYPQVRVIGALGHAAARVARPVRAAGGAAAGRPTTTPRSVAEEFCQSLVAAGTTTALVFGSHFAGAVDQLFTVAQRHGLRVTSGLVVSDRGLPEPLLTTPERAHEESLALACRWHGDGRVRYAVTPRFSLSASEAMLEACAAAVSDIGGAWFTSHVNENLAEVAEVRRLFGSADHYTGTYDAPGPARGAVGPRPQRARLRRRAGPARRAAHRPSPTVPSSNSALGSGLFPLTRHVAHGVAVALGSDVGAGTGFSLFKEGLQAYFMQRLLGPDGLPLTPAHLLHLATAAGARALGLADRVGDLSVGKEFDAICLRPVRGTELDIGLRHTDSAEEALGKIFALASDADVADVWVGGQQIASGGFVRGVAPGA